MLTDAVNDAVKDSPPLTVLYDGACRLCRREIGVYRGLRPLRLDLAMCFADVGDAASPPPPGNPRAQGNAPRQSHRLYPRNTQHD